ncbi:MAG TPA: alkaline phosphatase family protein, partial [Atribacterota bacterium]|nr:alkaline phosphatase family protein [Atribacterota bacterium]
MTIKNTRYEPGMKQHPESEEKTFLTISTIKRASMVLFVVLFMVFLFLSGAIYAKSVPEPKPKFLIVHLDAVSSPNFFQYMEDGYLSNLKAIFKEGHTIKYGLSLFPGGTEMIYPRLKQGLGNETGESVGWGYYDRAKEKVVSDLYTFSHLFSSLPRRARTSVIYGIPWMDTFMFLPMINIPQLLETYGVIELIWFATDATGHALNEKIYLDSIRRFDSYFGKMVKRLNLEEVNLILYCDHGMSFNNELYINHNSEIKRVVGEGLQAILFPNVYLKDVNLKEYYAQKIVQETEIDLAFFKENENPDCVTGYSPYGKV